MTKPVGFHSFLSKLSFNINRYTITMFLLILIVLATISPPGIMAIILDKLKKRRR